MTNEPMKRTAFLLVGPPGSGKVSWARQLAENVSLEAFNPYYSDCRYIYRVTGLSRDEQPLSAPFRAPHHSVSEAGLFGSLRKGWNWQPGEVSLAHGGVLLMDEVFEFKTALLLRLANAWRAGRVELTSERETRWFPCEFRLVLSCNPCACGFLGSERGAECDCTVSLKRRHLERISWLVHQFPGIERIDLPAAGEEGLLPERGSRLKRDVRERRLAKS